MIITKSSSSVITNNPEHERHFNIVTAYFFNQLAEKSPYSNVGQIKQIEYIVNPKLLFAYEETKKHLEVALGKPVKERYGYHGTNANAMEKIFEEGFKIGGKDVKKQNGALYGNGVYLATNPGTAKNYCRGNSKY